MQNKVCCFGELLVRLSPPEGAEWSTHPSMPFFIGGAELNVATALAKWNTSVSYVTALPDNYLSGQLIQYIHQNKIDCSHTVFSGNRLGIYYLPVGFDLKNSIAIYDREHTAFSTLKPGVIDWDSVFTDCSWFHFSAISPALNENVAAVCKEALDAAVQKGLTISVDLNYREKLWQYNQSPETVMPELVQHCHVIMGNLWAVEKLLGIPSPIEKSEGKTEQELTHAATASMLQLQQRFPQASTFAYTYRMNNHYWAVLRHEANRVVSKKYAVEHVIDKVGSGDCFMGGLIYGLIHQHTPQHMIDFAAAAAVGKLQEKGDATSQSTKSIQARMTHE